MLMILSFIPLKKKKRTLELMLTQDRNNIANWLDKNKLIINLKKGKTESMLLAHVNV